MTDPVPPVVPEDGCFVVGGIFQVERWVSRQVAAALAADDATVEEWRLLRLLADGVPRQMGEIARSLSMPDASVTRLVSGLADRSLVYRRQSELDRRRATVHLARHGRARLKTLDAIVQAYQDALLSSPEWALICEGMSRAMDEGRAGAASDPAPRTDVQQLVGRVGLEPTTGGL